MFEVLMASPDSSSIGTWVVIGLLAVGGAANWKKAFGGRPSVGELTTREQLGTELKGYASKAEMAEHKVTVEKELESIEKNQETMKAESKEDAKEIKEMIRGLGDKVEASAEKAYQARGKIHEKVNESNEKVTKHGVRLDEHDKQLKELRERQDKFLDERKVING